MEKLLMDTIIDLNNRFSDSSPQQVIEYFLANYKGKIALASSMSIEDQVLTDMIVKQNNSTKIFTLDTGRLPYETYNLIDRTNEIYNIKIDVYFPESKQLEEMVKNKGINLFYNSVEERKLCCSVRKLEPLKRALTGLDVWICGLRREQSVTRENIGVVEYDSNNRMIKLNPLFNWTENDVWAYIHKHNVIYNTLYKNNYLSIGCAPCTRPVAEGGDIRSGRWWWENPETKECGLHIKQ